MFSISCSCGIDIIDTAVKHVKYFIQKLHNMSLGHLPPPSVYRIRTWAGVESHIRKREFYHSAIESDGSTDKM